MNHSLPLLRVLLPVPQGDGYDYTWPDPNPPAPGTWVEAPFGKRTLIGVVDSHPAAGTLPPEKIRPLLNMLPAAAPLSLPLLRWLHWVADYTLTPPGMLLKMVCPVPDALTPSERRRLKQLPTLAAPHLSLHPLSAQQQHAADAVITSLNAHQFQPFVLDGITGSGKTEVYFTAIAHALQQGGQVLVMLPEIALTSQWLERFRQRFGMEPVVWHSGISPARRREAWRAIASGEAKLVVGARSALFLPYARLSLLVVDEEHEAAYKQEDGVLYQARDMAVVRAMMEHVPILLVSATPALESWQNIRTGKYRHLQLTERHGKATLPAVTLVDMRPYKLSSGSFISPPLQQAVRDTLERGEQALLFLNRRGFAPLTLCRGCGHRLACPHCTAWLVLHHPKKGTPYLQCHHCGFSRPPLQACPECHAEGDKLVPCGPGTERLVEEAKSLFPTARIAEMSSDALTTPQATEALLEAMTYGEVDILIGTQMVAKGHHFPKLTLVGIVDGDSAAQGSDLRAAERSFQLLHQVAGRAGREDAPGQVLIQSFDPTQPVLQALQRHDRDGFYRLELKARELAHMPPFARLAGIIVSGKNEAQVQHAARQLAITSHQLQGVTILGPAPAPMYRLRQLYRYRFLASCPLHYKLQPSLHHWLETTPLPSSVTVRVDIDPYSFM